MPQTRIGLLTAVVLSLGMHAGLLTAWSRLVSLPGPSVALTPKPLQASLLMEPVQKESVENMPAPEPVQQARKAARLRPAPSTLPPSAPLPSQPSLTGPSPVSAAAPPPPTAEEWAQASTYTPRNSKRYRYNWGQQVRSMMGTVVEGPQQGHVRFRIEIAPDGKVAKIETLWSTSDVATRLARQAIASLPPLPPTPTGQPLVFEQTIAYVPYESGWPPIYKYDCLPEPPKFRNPFVWDGNAPQGPAKTVSSTDSGCSNAGPPDSIEAEAADFKRQLDFWGARPLNGVK